MSRTKKIVLLGASFSTGNLGVSALAWSVVKLIRGRWPESEICVVGGVRQKEIFDFISNNNSVQILVFPVRYTPKLFVADHILWLLFITQFSRWFPFINRFYIEQGSTLGKILDADLICDITGGDSFSDLYGINRLLQGYLLKRVCQISDKPFVLLPQTYGPFNGSLAKMIARSILSRSTLVFSRDQEGLEQINRLTNNREMITPPQLCPDVAFILEAKEPESDTEGIRNRILKLKSQNSTIIGLNISGLLFHGGYSQDNMFDLSCDYELLIKNLITSFSGEEGNYLLLVPHVIPENMPIENDLEACRKIWRVLPLEIQNKVIVLDMEYDQNEIKYWIGMCDFFLGSRMHATIAALSQCIPAVGLAYSKKFAGVFETAGVKECVVDMRQENEDDILAQSRRIYECRADIRIKLESKIPEVKERVRSIFDNLQL